MILKKSQKWKRKTHDIRGGYVVVERSKNNDIKNKNKTNNINNNTFHYLDKRMTQT